MEALAIIILLWLYSLSAMFKKGLFLSLRGELLIFVSSLVTLFYALDTNTKQEQVDIWFIYLTLMLIPISMAVLSQAVKNRKETK